MYVYPAKPLRVCTCIDIFNNVKFRVYIVMYKITNLKFRVCIVIHETRNMKHETRRFRVSTSQL